jgi:Histidine kinase-, DNA gyrase B-, and HSP90-like ATPase
MCACTSALVGVGIFLKMLYWPLHAGMSRSHDGRRGAASPGILSPMIPMSNARGKLKIGDDWNAIRIIALSQNNPLKAIAEFVENSVDAHARTVTITRGREHGEHYLSIKDDGEGVPRDAV